MTALPENRPAVELGVTITHRFRTGEAIATVWTIDRFGSRLTLARREWATGRPTPAELDLLGAEVTQTVTDCVLSALGVQGVLVT